MRLLRISFFIGWLWIPAQTGPAQGPAELMNLEGRSPLVRQIDELLRGDPGRWPEAWSSARAIGPAIAPLLWEKLRRERRVSRRPLWLCAHMAASGAGGGRVLERSFFEEGREDEQVLALLALAAAPEAPARPGALRRVVAESPSDAVRLAAALVLARGADATPLPANWLTGRRQRDPGLVAAGVLCGGGVTAAVLDHWLLARDAPDPAAQLVWRAVLMARHPLSYSPTVVLEKAQQALRWDSDAVQPTRRAAALAVSRAEDPAHWLDSAAAPLPAELVLLLSESPAGAATAIRRGWLSPVPSPRLDASLRRQLAVQYARHATPEQIRDATPAWRAAGELGPALCLALAWRVVAVGDVYPGPWMEALSGSEEILWAKVALGEEIAPESLPPDAPPALALAAAGRLPPRALADQIERELWRRESHPGIPAWVCWTSLVRDLLLSGSQYAQSRDARRDPFPYLPRALQADDSVFFQVACQYFDWLVAPARGDVPDAVGW